MKEFPVRLTYVRPRYDQRGRLNQPDDGDEDRVSSIFAKDGLYLLVAQVATTTTQLWRLTCTYSKSLRARGRRDCEFVPKSTAGYALLLRDATRVCLADIPSQFRTKRYQYLISIPSIADSIETNLEMMSTDSMQPLHGTETPQVLPNQAAISHAGATTQLALPETSDAQVKALQASLASSDARAEALQSSLASSDACVKTLQSSLASSDARGRALQSAFAASDTEVKELQSSLAASDTEVKELQSSLAASDSVVKTLRSSLAVSVTEIEDLKSSLVAPGPEIEDLKSSLAASETEIKELKSSLAASETEIKELKSSLAASDARESDLESELSQCSAKVGSLEALVANSTARWAPPASPRQLDETDTVDIISAQPKQVSDLMIEERAAHAAETRSLSAALEEHRAYGDGIRKDLDNCQVHLRQICAACRVDTGGHSMGIGQIATCLQLCSVALSNISGAYEVLCFVLRSSSDAQQCVAQLYLDN